MGYLIRDLQKMKSRVGYWKKRRIALEDSGRCKRCGSKLMEEEIERGIKNCWICNSIYRIEIEEARKY